MVMSFRVTRSFAWAVVSSFLAAGIAFSADTPEKKIYTQVPEVAPAGTTPPAADAPRDLFNLVPGFQVERLFTVPKDELGSWVCMTTDPKGRLIVSDQGQF